MAAPFLSLIVPTRERPESLRRMLASVAGTSARPDELEVLLVIDADDATTMAVVEPRLAIRRVVQQPGATMGTLNMAGYEAARGRWLMLLNDDVIARTPGWDNEVRRCIAAYPDEILLIHVNDLVMQKHLCTFPIVSRTYCEMVGGICPRGYRRYRIDDHIEDYFNLLNALGERRIVYAPEVIFEHANYVVNESGLRQYFSKPDVLTLDAPLFDRLAPERREAALRLKLLVCGQPIQSRWRRTLEGVVDHLTLRTPNRQRILTEHGIVDPWDLEPSLRERLQRCVRERGWSGLAYAVLRRLRSVVLQNR